jgi:glycosyltransferase involved in cell wall biosynthesis
MHESSNSTDLPTITVGITTFDRTELLIESVHSVINQTYPKIEIIIGNDNPERKLTLESLGLEEDSGVRIENHSNNLGEISNLNWLLKESSGEYFTWLADDDLMHNQHIELLWKQFTLNANIDAAYSGFTSDIDKFLNLTNAFLTEDDSHIYNFKSFLNLYSRREIKLIGCYGIFRKKSLIDAGGFFRLGKGFSPYSDTLIPILISRKSDIAYLPVSTIFFRSHSASMSNSLTDLDAYISAEFDFLDQIRGSVSVETLEFQSEIYEAFYNWFRENQLTVILRPANPINRAFISWLRACAFNNKNFRRFGFNYRRGILDGLIIIIKHRVRTGLLKT